jgi:hypothetical protein
MMKINDVNYQAKILAQKNRANTLISELDFTAPGSIQAKYGEWKQDYFDSADDLTAERAGAWRDISQEDKDRIFQEEFGARNGPMTSVEKDEVYAKWRFDKKVANAETGLISDTIYKDLKANGATDETLEAIQNGVNYLLADPNATPLSLDGMTFLPGDLQGRKAEHLFENWSGEDYNETDNKWSERSQFDLDMDTMWKSYVKGLDEGEMPPSHDDFIKAARKAGYAKGDLPSRSEIENSTIIQDKKIAKSEAKQVMASHGVTDYKSLQELDPGEMSKMLAEGVVDGGMLTTELGALKDINNLLSPPSSTGDRKLTNEWDKDFGIQAIVNSNRDKSDPEYRAMPNYIVSNGSTYQVGSVETKPNVFSYYLTAMDESGLSHNITIDRVDKAYRYNADGTKENNNDRYIAKQNDWNPFN